MMRIGGPEMDYRDGWLTGDAESIRRGAQAFIDAGIGELIVQIQDVESPATLAGAAGALVGLQARASSEVVLR